jgi:hypothetical protein
MIKEDEQEYWPCDIRAVDLVLIVVRETPVGRMAKS